MTNRAFVAADNEREREGERESERKGKENKTVFFRCFEHW